jgi:hypothetical protein
MRIVLLQTRVDEINNILSDDKPLHALAQDLVLEPIVRAELFVSRRDSSHDFLAAADGTDGVRRAVENEQRTCELGGA